MTLIRKPAELTTPATIKMLLYGQPGIGKTTLALSAPSPLLLDFDGGIHRVNPVHQVDTVQITSWEDCVNVLKEDLTAYRSLIIDTAGKQLDFIAANIIKNDPKMGRKDGQLSLQGFGVRKVAFVNFLKQASILGKHLIFVAHDREERDGDNKIIRPEIGGSSSGDLIKEIDLVGYMEASGKKRTISFDPCEKFYGKNTCGLDPLIDVPELTGVKNIFLQGIIEKYNNAIEKRREVAGAYNELLARFNAMLDNVNDAETANNYVEEIKKTDHVWDSKLQAGEMIKVKAAALGLSLNKTSRKYEHPKAA